MQIATLLRNSLWLVIGSSQRLNSWPRAIKWVWAAGCWLAHQTIKLGIQHILSRSWRPRQVEWVGGSDAQGPYTCSLASSFLTHLYGLIGSSLWLMLTEKEQIQAWFVDLHDMLEHPKADSSLSTTGPLWGGSEVQWWREVLLLDRTSRSASTYLFFLEEELA